MNKQVIFYNHDNDSLVTIPIEWTNDHAILVEPEKLNMLGLKRRIASSEVEKLILPKTFTISFSNKQGPLSMTYNEWETLRSTQANQQIQAKISNLVDDDIEKTALAKVFDDLTEDMRNKYLGQKSWTEIYEGLFENLK